MGFPESPVGKQSACNIGDPGFIPGMERSTEEGIGYPLQYSWTSFVTQQVNNLLAVQETWVWSLSWEDPLDKGKATHSSMLAWGIPWIPKIASLGPKTLDTTERLWLWLSLLLCLWVCFGLSCQARDMGSIPGSRRFHGEENGNPLQYPCLGNPMMSGAWQAIV